MEEEHAPEHGEYIKLDVDKSSALDAPMIAWSGMKAVADGSILSIDTSTTTYTPDKKTVITGSLIVQDEEQETNVIEEIRNISWQLAELHEEVRRLRKENKELKDKLSGEERSPIKIAIDKIKFDYEHPLLPDIPDSEKPF